MSGHSKFAVLVLVLFVTANLVWAQPLCSHHMASLKHPAECSMTAMGSSASVAPQRDLRCCHVAPAQPVPKSVLSESGFEVGPVAANVVSITSGGDRSLRTGADESRSPVWTPEQARLCVFLI